MRRRILAATLAVAAIALVIFGVPFGWALGRVYHSQQQTRLQQAATIAAAAVPAEGMHGADPIEPTAAPAGVILTYYDEAGAVVAGPKVARPDGHVLRALAGHPSQGRVGSRLVVALPVTVNEATIGAVEASSPSSVVAARTIRSWVSMLLLGAVAMGLAAVIGLWQSRRLARPVADLTAAAERLGEGDFALRTSPSGIGEVDRASRALEATSGRLGELMERQRAFTAHASHQLRTPLTALRLELENALDTPGVDGHTALRDALREVDRFQATLEQLFVLARSGSPPAQHVAVGDVLADVEQRWHPVLAARGRRLSVVVDTDLAGRSVPATLAQILDILVDNGVTHGRGKVEVTVSSVAGASELSGLSAAAHGLSISVADEGDGMGTVEVDREDADADRHGVGLVLASSLAVAAGGRLATTRTDPHPIVTVLLP